MSIIFDNADLKNPNLSRNDRRRLGKKGAGRWIYCKYCYKNVLPVIDEPEGLIVCSECGYGLALLKEDKNESSN